MRAASSFGGVQRAEHASKLARERLAEPAGSAVALAQRNQVSGEVRQAHLPLGVVHVQVDRVAVGHDHPTGLLRVCRAVVENRPCVACPI